jgi:hypothetical protein
MPNLSEKQIQLLVEAFKEKDDYGVWRSVTYFANIPEFEVRALFDPDLEIILEYR